mgnify:CR=1 FL=1
MGRLLKRVPVNFDYPKGQIWKGYVNPYRGLDCHTCEGTGFSKEYKELQDKWYSLDNWEPVCLSSGRSWNKNAWHNNLSQQDVDWLAENNDLWDFTRVPLNEDQKENCFPNGWTKEHNGYKPTAEEVNEWSRSKPGAHISEYGLIKHILKTQRKPHTCRICKGSGKIWQTPEIKKAHDRWKDFEPPEGDAFQLWENTSEGSPQSPVFKTLDELCEWAETSATTFGSSTATKEEWKKMLDDCFVYHKEGNTIFV